MGIDPSQPKGDGSEHSSSQSKENQAEGVSDLSGLTDADWDALFYPAEPVIDPLHRELGIVTDGVGSEYNLGAILGYSSELVLGETDIFKECQERCIAEHRLRDVLDFVEQRVPDELFKQTWFSALGETEDGRLVVSLKFLAPSGSLIPPRSLFDKSDESLSWSSGDATRKRVRTKERQSESDPLKYWERVSGEVTCIFTQRTFDQCSDGFTAEFKTSSMAVVEKLFSAIADKNTKQETSLARYLLDRCVAERMVEEIGAEPLTPDYILISPLEKSEHRGSKLTVVVAVQPPGYDYFHAIEGRDIQVGLSAGKRVAVANGTWYHRGPAAAYVEELERREQRRREGAD